MRPRDFGLSVKSYPGGQTLALQKNIEARLGSVHFSMNFATLLDLKTAWVVHVLI